MSKAAVFTMDVEAFYDTLCAHASKLEQSISMKDGLTIYLDFLEERDIKANLFILDSFLKVGKEEILEAIKKGHHIGIHGMNHQPPLCSDIEDFRRDVQKAKEKIGKEFSVEVLGYRAPCFSLDNERLKVLQDVGYKYDSSRLDFARARYSGKINVTEEEIVNRGTYNIGGMWEFELPIGRFFGRKFPISGGGYFRIFPWLFLKRKIRAYIKKHDVFVFYLHPFETSKERIPKIKGLKFYDQYYFRAKRKKLLAKVDKLIKLLKKYDYEFKTFEDLMGV